VTWQEYNSSLIPLIQTFGDFYSQDKIKTGWFYWKSKPVHALNDEVNRAISAQIPLSLNIIPDNSKSPTRSVYKHDKYDITDGFLEDMLKKYEVTSCVELMFKLKSS
jgi:hypothetical protein